MSPYTCRAKTLTSKQYAASKVLGTSRVTIVQWFNCPLLQVSELNMKTAVFNFQNASVDVVALVNDTTGTMMSCAFNNPDVSAGLILGTGTNACYMESLDNVPKWTGDYKDPREVIINTEWGAFGDNGSWNHLRTAFDEKVDRESINPGMQL